MDRVCHTCQGSGITHNSMWRDWWKKHKDDWEKALLHGDDVPTTPDRQECHVCHGTGYLLTEAGEALLAFLARHGRIIKQYEGARRT